LRIVERESEESAREVLPRVRARGEVEEEDPVLRDAIEKTSSLPPKPNSLPPQLDRFIPLRSPYSIIALYPNNAKYMDSCLMNKTTKSLISMNFPNTSFKLLIGPSFFC
jgi:hypothetical protein